MQVWYFFTVTVQVSFKMATVLAEFETSTLFIVMDSDAPFAKPWKQVETVATGR